MHIVPLAEVISLVLGISTLTSTKIKARWDTLIARFGSEINVLVDADVGELKRFDPEVGAIVERFRTGRMKYVGGGGGQYGRPTLKNEGDVFYGVGQKTLSDF
jgi:PHP family Zn ribbon phosphoesterase